MFHSDEDIELMQSRGKREQIGWAAYSIRQCFMTLLKVVLLLSIFWRVCIWSSSLSSASATTSIAFSSFRDGINTVTQGYSPSPSVGIVSLNFGSGSRHPSNIAGELPNSELYAMSKNILKTYAERWRYPLFTFDHLIMEGPIDAERQGLLSKEALVLSVMLSELQKEDGVDRLQWLYFVDADSVMMNHNVPLDIFLPPPSNDKDDIKLPILMVSIDQWGTMNSGGFMIRVCTEGLQFLAALIAEGTYVDSSIWRGSDQALMARVAKKPEFIDSVVVVPQNWFNADAFSRFDPKALQGKAREVYRDGDLMIHFMGGAHYKTGWTSAVRGAIEQEQSKVAIPVSETRYMKGSDTIKDFWSQRAMQTLEQKRERVLSCKVVVPKQTQKERLRVAAALAEVSGVIPTAATLDLLSE